MKLSSKGRYAVRVMVDLAVNDDGKCIKVKEIAKRQDISEKYLEQIIAVLNKAGYVRSVRGAQGGYRLTKDPSQYTVGMILRLTEGNLSPVPCLEDEVNQCERADECETLDVWKRLAGAINMVVDSVTIADLMNKHKMKHQEKDIHHEIC
jgi:Rrf2 family protein